MNCMAIDCLYIKANAEVPCWCSPGEHHPILQLDPETVRSLDIVEDVLNGPEFRRMRSELHADRLPFDYCQGCSFLRNDGPDAWKRVDTSTHRIASINTLQIESSFLCNVDCPLCVRLPVRKQAKDPPYQLDPALFRKVVDDLVRHGIAVGEIWFSGRGEPLMNPDFSSMVAYGKQHLGSRVTAHTNGNFRFKDELVTCGLDEIEIAFDGVDQETYGRYRRGGKLDRVVEFATAFAEARKRLASTTPELVWKMVLFEWNSSDADLTRAVAWAEELGLDRVLFMNTDTPGGISYSDGGQRLAAIRPLAERLAAAHPGIKVEVAGYHSAYEALPEVETTLRTESSDGGTTVVLGRLFNHMLEDRHVRVELRLQDESGGPDRVLVNESLQLPERAEFVESFAVSHDGLAAGTYRVWAAVSDAESGTLLSEAACDFVLES